MSLINKITRDVKSGTKTAREYVLESFDKIEQNKDFNAVLSVARERALKRADEIDAKVKNGEQLGRLAGVPFAAKDNFLTLDTTSTASSNILNNFKAPFQATAIEKLEAEGAIMVAKTNLDSFGHGASTENSDFGVTKNPHDPTCVAGGSSGGSAAAVALGIVPFALGTDTGGSVRQPSSFCGVMGVKPTYGSISRYGVIAMASSTDTIGVIAQNADDASLAFDVMAGQDKRDATTLPRKTGSFLAGDNTPKKLKIGVIKEYMSSDTDPHVLRQVNEKIQTLRDLGHEVSEVSLPSLPLALAVYYIVVPAEVSSNLMRYDGVKYGHSYKDAKTLDELYGVSRDQGFNAENKRRILIGTYVLSSGHIDAYYRKAQTVRTKLINEFSQAFSEFDVLVGPVAPTTAFKIGENAVDPLKMYLADVMTVAASLAGLPSFSVPAGTDDNNLPIGMQLIGAQASDGLLFGLAKQLEAQNG